MSARTYPHIRAQITDGEPGMLVVAWVQRAPGDAAQFLLRQEKADSLAEVIELLARLARQEGIAPENVDVDLPLQTLLCDREGTTNFSSDA